MAGVTSLMIQKRAMTPHSEFTRVKLLTQFVEQMPGAVAMFDRDMRYLAASKRWCADYGVESSRLSGRSHYEVFPETSGRWKEGHTRALTGEIVQAEQDLFVRADGGKAWRRWAMQPWSSHNGPAEGVLVWTENITSLVDAQESLQAGHSQLEHILAAVPEAICVFRRGPDGAWSLPFVSPAFHQMLPGLERPADLLRVINLEEAAGITTAASHWPTQGEVWRGSCRVRLNSGLSRRVEIRAFRATDPTEGAVFYATLTDITGKRARENRPYDPRSVIAPLFESAPLGMLAVSEDGSVVLANRVAETMFGYAPGSLVGKKYLLLLPEFVTSGQVRMTEPARQLFGRRADGTEFPVEVSPGYIRTRGGFLAVSFVVDVSTRIRHKQELAALQNEIARLNLSLLSAEEKAARGIARELHDDISQRLAFLSILIGRAADMDADDAARQKQLRTWQTCIVDLSEDIRSIAGELHPAILDELGLSAAIAGLCRDFGGAGDASIPFEARNIPDDVDPATAICLYRVCQEALHNIAKHAGKNAHPTVLLAGDEKELRLIIADHGGGFDTSSRAHGLGFHSMEERIHMLRGTLSITSTRGQGTVVDARIPIAKSRTNGPPARE